MACKVLETTQSVFVPLSISCSVLPSEIVMHDARIGLRSENDIIQLLLFSECRPICASCMTISGGRTEQHVIIAGFLPRHWLYG